MGCATRKDPRGSRLALLAGFSASFPPYASCLSPVPTGDWFRDCGDSVPLPDPGSSGSETVAWQGLRFGALLSWRMPTRNATKHLRFSSEKPSPRRTTTHLQNHHVGNRPPLRAHHSSQQRPLLGCSRRGAAAEAGTTSPRIPAHAHGHCDAPFPVTRPLRQT